MKINLQNYLLTMFLIAFVSCAKSTKEDLPQITGYDEKTLSNGEGLNIESFDIISLEQTDRSVINMIKRVEIIDSLIIIQADDKLLSFNRKGKFICQYGERGNGPSEYMEIHSYVLNQNDKTIKIIDEAADKSITFDLNGNYLSNKRYGNDFFTWTNTGIYIDDENILFNCRIYKDMNVIYTIINLDKEQNTPLYNFPGKAGNIPWFIGNNMTMSHCMNEINLTVPFNNKVYTLKNGEIIPKISIPTKKQMVTDKQQKEINNYSIDLYAEFLNNGYFTGFTGICESDKYILLDELFGSNYFLIDKATNSGRLYNYSTYNGIKALPLIKIIECHDNCFIGVGIPYHLKEMRNQFSENITDKNILKLKNYVDTFDYDGNPCVFLYKIK